MEKDKSFFSFYALVALLYAAANIVHAVTPTLIIERGLDSSMFGVALAATLAATFLFAPMWGKLCGYMPTRRVMLIGCLGYALGQMIFGSAMTNQNVILGRLFSGIFSSGTLTASTNYLINMNGDDLAVRGKRLVILVTVQNVASACGYFIGGFLGLVSVMTAFTVQCVMLAVVGILFAILEADDTPYKEKPISRLTLRDINPFSAFLAARSYMTPLLLMLLTITAISAIGQNSYEQCFNYYIRDRFGMSSAYNGTFKAVIAILTLTINASVGIYLQKRKDIHKSFLWVLGACCLLNFAAVITTNKFIFVAIYIIYSSVMVLRLPLLQAMTAQMTTKSSSNQVMGVYQSMNSLGGIFGALFAGLIYDFNPRLPFVLALAAYMISILVGLAFRKRCGESE